jgi:leucyl-tRNA synthetase
LLEYGTGFIMAVPAHDQRDFEFAKKYEIPIKVVIKPKDKKLDANEMKRAFTEEGIMVNSGEFDGLNSEDAIEKISDYLEKNNSGKKAVNYKLKDWCISRQRYWGTPIPVIYCDKCGIIPAEIPVLLPPPEKVKFTGHGNPLETAEEFVNTKCPKCKGSARRETDTMDTFVDSSWYFFRFCNPDSKEVFDKEKVKYWMPIDFYVGGIEHATGHLIYCRFFTKVFADLKLINFREPAKKLLTQGMLTLGGHAMSKSRGNVIDPLKFAKEYSLDTARLFILSAALPEKELEWSDKGAQGSFRLIKKIYGLLNLKPGKNVKDRIALSKLNKTIKEVTKSEFSLAIVSLSNFISYIYKNNENISKKVLDEIKNKMVYLISPFVPHLAEEMGDKLKLGLVSTGKWPAFDGKKIQPKLEAEEDFISQVISDIEEIKKLGEIKPKKISIYVSPAWKYEIYNMVFEKKELKEIMTFNGIKKYGNEAKKFYQRLEKRKPLDEIFLTASAERTALNENKDFLEKEFGCKIEIESGEKVDYPKAKIAEPGKPGILIE